MRIREAGGAVEVGPLPVVQADPTQMRQLMQNLIGNALKYRREEASPVVRVESGPVAPDAGAAGRQMVEITFRDNGIGFDEKYKDRIFGVFQRLHGRLEYEGTGIGLAICRKIVERHNGKIDVRSKPGTGTTFTVQLPVQQAHEEDAQAEDGSDVPRGPRAEAVPV
jgi:signal transduction histidine kinase